MSEMVTAHGADLAAPPVIDEVHESRLQLLSSKWAAASDGQALTKGEIGAALELCKRYELDPFANEVWLAKSRGRNGGAGKLLLMVGRDGLRKVATRNGLVADGDVIHENDEFRVERTADGSRAVHHAYGHPKDRGDIVGAWCEVREREALVISDGDVRRAAPGRVRGFFVANVDEFRPTNDNQLRYSPWGSQASVMMLAAAERQALRQATPLAGLVVEGETARMNEIAEEGLSVAPAVLPDDLPMREAVEHIVARARTLNHAALSDVATVAMTLDGQPPEYVGAWVESSAAQLDRLAQAEPADAEVVPDEPPADDSETAQALAAKADQDEAYRLRTEAGALIEAAEAEEDNGEDAEGARLRGEAEPLFARADELDPPPVPETDTDQPSLLDEEG